MTSPLPGAPARDDALAARLAAALASKGPGYRPRTHHLDPAGRPRFTNRLVLETSPYLLQHAHNPVDWRPWGDEAFDEARRTHRPVFLSVGYSTCHWCHVMEGESFEDLEVARTMNELYVPVKLDREERPDVDAVYMAAVQALQGGGGWPMSVWLDPDRRPFFAGTYFPARDGDRGAPKGFLTILREIRAIWDEDPARVGGAASSLAEAVRTVLGAGAPTAGDALPGDEVLAGAVRFFSAAYDDRHGGVRRAPKFPSSFPVRLLLRWHRRTLDARVLDMAVRSLERMAAGGLMDQVGGGFHRYSVDDRWLVPHFEKMLYDNALLAVAYTEAWQATRRRDLARVVRQTLDYLLREMRSAGGAFYSATDADSEGEEGKFFVWDERELRRVLGEDAERFIRFHGVTPQGNFEGANVLFVPAPDEDEWAALAPARAALYAAREARPRPLRDEKILAAWNGLAIGAFALAGRVFGDEGWVEAARRAARFVLDRMRPGGLLQRVSGKDGEARVPGFLDDHAFLAQGLLELFEATFEPEWLAEALSLSRRIDAEFADPAGGWFTTSARHERLLARQKPTHDGAEPSGASVATLNALRLHAFTGDDRWRRSAEGALRVYAPVLAEHPAALTEMLLAVDYAADAAREVVIVWRDRAEAEPFLAVLRETFLPSRALLGAAEGEELHALARLAPVARDRVAIGGRPTAYVCERGQCQLPAISPEKLAGNLATARPIRSGADEAGLES